ncbi:MAG: hypothetical protein DRJ10_07530 [Bacteroidetes bacterium]|nr:MAG: hypothetical protein DRJ10_07530 [Bacteroidota bacterium]
MENKSYAALGRLYFKQKNSKKAYIYSKKAYLMAKKTREFGLQKEASEILAKSCEFSGLYKEAYQYYVVFKTINDSLYNEKNLRKITGLEYKYKYEKEKQAAELEQHKKDIVLAKKANKQLIIRNSFIGGFILMLLLALIVFRSLTQKRKANLILAMQKQDIEEKNAELSQQKEEIQSQAEKLQTANNNLQKLNATKDKFFSIIAHDLKSPFNTMLGFSEILNDNFDKYDIKEQKKLFGIVHSGIQNTYKLLEDLLLWSRSQKGIIDFNPQKVKLYELSNDIVELLTQSAESKTINIINKIPKDIYVHADKEMLSTIIRNLISNAIKFTQKEGTVEIGIQTNHGLSEHKTYVKDNGIGIPKKIQSDIFEVGESTSTKGTEGEIGTGLGLILCKEFVDKHGGKIWVESEVGKGSEFIFTLPVI